MTEKDIFDFINSNKVKTNSPCTDTEIILANASLQQMQAAILPKFISELYKKTGYINLNDAYIFGPLEISRIKKASIPSITEINKELRGVEKIRGKTIFARNDLFLFAFDSFGDCFMLDNLSLKPLKKYNDPYQSIYECLIIGKN